MENSTGGLIVGFLMVMAGTAALITQSTTFVLYRRLRNLARHGVEGEAVSVDQKYAGTGEYHIHYEIRLADGEPGAEFRERQRGMADLGTVVPVVYDRRKPRRAKRGFLKDIDYRGERNIVLVFGYGGLAVFAGGVALLVAVNGW
ncbi:DUF3592 domain-containing protein [Streptomyces sp. NPDC049687]|uniref:DUF3592 domain-containing protein n=1 Tax=Streptomyces sp. NPDC049687 TaxID=3365596 RepID=UPI0037B84158